MLLAQPVGGIVLLVGNLSGRRCKTVHFTILLVAPAFDQGEIVTSDSNLRKYRPAHSGLVDVVRGVMSSAKLMIVHCIIVHKNNLHV
jgi:hypothetical protein